MKRALLLAVLVLPLSCAVAQEAQDDQATSRRTGHHALGGDAGRRRAGKHLGFDQYKFSVSSIESKSTVAAEFEYGLTDRWELDAEVPYEFVRPQPRDVLSMASVTWKRRCGTGSFPLDKQPVAHDRRSWIWDPHRRPHARPGRRTAHAGTVLHGEHVAGPVNAQFNCGWQRAVTNAGEEPRDEFKYNVAVLYPVDRWFLVLEGNGASTREATAYYVTPELIWRPMTEPGVAGGRSPSASPTSRLTTASWRQ